MDTITKTGSVREAGLGAAIRASGMKPGRCLLLSLSGPHIINNCVCVCVCVCVQLVLCHASLISSSKFPYCMVHGRYAIRVY